MEKGSSESVHSVENCELVDAEEYQFEESLVNYLLDKYDEVKVDYNILVHEVRMYNAEMGVESDEDSIISVLENLGYIKEV